MYLRKECSNFTSSNSGHEKCDKNTTLYDKPLLCASLVLCCDQQNNCFPKLSQSAGAVAGLEAYPGLVASGLIFLQLLAIGMICYRSYRLLGLWMTFGIVTVFTGYNGFILMDSNNLPCTCIGLFEKMTWKGNLNLNMGLMITALVGIISMKAGRSKMKK